MSKLITVGRLGTLRGLQFRRGAGFDLRTMGKAAIVRISEILWDEERQSWFVKFLRGELAGVELRSSLMDELFPDGWPGSVKVNLKWRHATCPKTRENEWTLCFDDYEDAVSAEVIVIQTARKAGLYKLA